MDYNIEIEGDTKKSDKNYKKIEIKDYSYRERLEKFGLTTLIEKRIETFKVINRILNLDEHFFNISPWTGNLLSRQISKTKCTCQWEVFANHHL